MERNTTFTEGKILQPLILFAMPVLFALFLQAMYGAVDLLVVGKFASSADVSAVSKGSQIMMTLTNLISCFAMGTTVLLGQLIGCGKKEEGGKGSGNGHGDVCWYCIGHDCPSGVFCTSDQQYYACSKGGF